MTADNFWEAPTGDKIAYLSGVLLVLIVMYLGTEYRPLGILLVAAGLIGGAQYWYRRLFVDDGHD